MVDFIKDKSKNLVNKANLWLALCMLKFSLNIRLDYAYKYIFMLIKPCSAFDA